MSNFDFEFACMRDRVWLVPVHLYFPEHWIGSDLFIEGLLLRWKLDGVACRILVSVGI